MNLVIVLRYFYAPLTNLHFCPFQLRKRRASGLLFAFHVPPDHPKFSEMCLLLLFLSSPGALPLYIINHIKSVQAKHLQFYQQFFSVWVESGLDICSRNLMSLEGSEDRSLEFPVDRVLIIIWVISSVISTFILKILERNGVREEIQQNNVLKMSYA